MNPESEAAPSQQEMMVAPPASARTAKLIVSLVLLLLIGSGAFTLLKRMQDSRVLAKQTEAESVPSV
ncbi:MAG: hypothetical protein ABSD20_04970, partial [Terriglobales bacterium]